MKIGIFDSGMGGLLITKSLTKKLPQYDYLYLGDTKHVPYGDKSQELIYKLTKNAIAYLFKHDCAVVIIACNTASAQALRKLQQDYLPKYFPGRNILGVIIPAAELVTQTGVHKKIGVLATQTTVASNVYPTEINKLDPAAKVFQQAAPLLVPIIEKGGANNTDPILREYLSPLLRKDITALILGCTHYPMLKSRIRNIVGNRVKIIAQNEFIPVKLKRYLANHPEVDGKLTKNGKIRLLVTKITPTAQTLTNAWFGKNITVELVSL